MCSSVLPPASATPSRLRGAAHSAAASPRSAAARISAAVAIRGRAGKWKKKTNPRSSSLFGGGCLLCQALLLSSLCASASSALVFFFHFPALPRMATAAEILAAAERGDAAALCAAPRSLLGVADAGGNTLLHIAAAHGRSKVLLLVLAHQAVDVRCVNASGDTAAHVAARSGTDGLVVWLWRAGADVRTGRNRAGETVRDCASAELQALLDGPEPHPVDLSALRRMFGLDGAAGAGPAGPVRGPALGQPAAAAVAGAIPRTAAPRRVQRIGTADAEGNRLFSAAHSGDADALRALLDQAEAAGALGSALTQVDIGGRNALHLACEGGHDEAVAVLLARGADPNREGEDLNTPLLIACSKGHFAIAVQLLDAGSNPNCRGLFRSAPLLAAAEMGHAEVVALLLGRGADAGVQDSEGNTALHLAALRGHAEIASLLVAHGTSLWRRNAAGATAVDLNPGVFAGSGGAAAAAAAAAQPSEREALVGGRAELEISAERLTVGELLGEGSVGLVFRAVLAGSSGSGPARAVALKQLRPGWQSRRTLESLSTEIGLLASLRHINVVRLVGVCTQPDRTGLVTDLAERGSLAAVLAREAMPELRLVSVLCGVLCGLHFLQQNRVIHRDVRAANVLLTGEWTAKLSDFGLSVRVDETTRSAVGAVGSLRWMAPEVFLGTAYTARADVYSFGMLVCEAVTRQVPFAALSPSQAANAAARDRVRPELPSGVLPALREAAERCWQAEPDARPGPLEVLRLLEAAERQQRSGGAAHAGGSVAVPQEAGQARTRPAAAAPPQFVVSLH
eukprot:TRINITY_DN191_c3_g1_i7.p1 TRINITY_DN191_c3_g1~~TRINITY_DN191_c3_g1_i7.p1  ORF type:complete len:796 (-),score=217.78 TRINITY_DN191_c3_g1_i7:33-2420(-)